ncbi:hypothetical protein GGR51DRAFT_530556 [Nemania sp. FL0031]|nr:hypothetical protein GGR51DRAFT_530556 [Nemania sp. FL0031]
MVTRILYSGVLALWLLISHALSQTTTTLAPASTTSTPASTSTFVSPSLHRGNGGGLSDDAKIGVSVGVTLAAIILVGSIAILCFKRGRHKALARPQTRTEVYGNMDEENTPVGGDSGKAQEGYYMSGTSTAHNGAPPQAQSHNGFVYQGGGGGYPTVPDQVYAPQQQQQQTYPIAYPTAYSGESYIYPGTAYSGTAVIDPNQQNGYTGPSHTQYQSEAHAQPQLHQPGGDVGWVYPVSATSPVDTTPVQDIQYNYLQDYQQHTQSPSPDQTRYQNRDASSSRQGYTDDAYYVPLPHPHASELPEQRKPVELMGEGHYREAP